ncbi:PepSY-associated TM helix domain protein [Filimonas lacunae]|nr:PepSY-associated TM helix domain protein [Filimonas lacunae]
MVVLVVALTGSILVFEDELEPILYRKELIVQPQETRLPVDQLIAVAKKEYPKIPVRQVRVFAEANRSVLVTFGKGKKGMKMVYVNPYTGKVLGKGNYDSRFFAVVTSLHRYLLMGDTGKVITGISCSMFFILTISGIVLWWPANKNAIKQRFRIKWDASFKRVNWDWHAVLGFYSAFFLLAISITGLVWSYQWVDGLIFTLSGTKPEKQEKVTNKSAIAVKAGVGVYEKALAATNQAFPFNGRVIINVPPNDSLAINTVKTNEEAAIPNRISTAWFDAGTGEQIQLKPFEKLNTGSQIRRIIYPIHTGSLFGWPTKMIALFVSLFAATLPVSGFLIWWGKKKKAKNPAAIRKNVMMQEVAAV